MATITNDPKPRRKLLRRWLATALACASALLFSQGYAQPDEPAPAETEIKAAFLYKFAGYVEWPQSSLGEAERPITIGIVGADQIAAELRRIVTGRTVQGRTLAVRAVANESDTRDIHVLFIGADADAQASRLLDAVRERPVLAITDLPDGLERGAMINFVMATRRVQFEIAVEPAEKAGLGLSSRLLSVAIRVKKGDIVPNVYIARQGEGVDTAG